MRLVKFLAEERVSLKRALRVPAPDPSEEYTEAEVEENLEILTAAVKELQTKENDLDVAAAKDCISKLRKWVKLCEDRFKETETCKKAKEVLKGKGPSKVTVPITPATPLPYKMAVKTGILPGQPEEEGK